MSTYRIACLALLIGGVLGFGINSVVSGINQPMSEPKDGDSSATNAPLYWVAPMDPNYQRDKPGKSPMGMDLIPVYADELNRDNDKPGTVKIDPAVENNLGVKTAAAEYEVLAPRIETVGYIAFDESLLWQTNVRVSGWVEKLFINAVGEKVKRGEVLFTLYSPELVKAQEELINAYQTKRKGMIEAATERLITLGVDKAQVKQIANRGRAFQSIEIKAPSDGIIASLNIREGGYLSPAQAVISAGPLDDVWVDAEVFERQSHWIEQGSEAVMTLDALPRGEWKGEVDYVYPILDPSTRTLRVRLRFPNPNGDLKPNMFANVTLKPVTSDKVLTIPRASVIYSGGMARVVLAQGGGKYRSVQIKVGREASDKVEVLQGLKRGERVVTSAHFMLDSESSQSADLSRINGLDAINDTVWASGNITMLMADFGMITVSHQPVSSWRWQAGERSFSVAEKDMLAGFEEGQTVDFLIEKNGSDFVLKQLKMSEGKQ